MRSLRVVIRDHSDLITLQLPLSAILSLRYVQGADPADNHLTFDVLPGIDLPEIESGEHDQLVFRGAQADDVARALRLHKPELRDDLDFGATLIDDGPGFEFPDPLGHPP